LEGAVGRIVGNAQVEVKRVVLSILFKGTPSASSLPRVENIRQQRAARRAALALAIAVAGVAEREAMALGIVCETNSQAPGAMRAAIAPAGVRGPDRVRAFAARKRQCVFGRVVAPDDRAAGGRRIRGAGGHKARQQQNCAQQKP
jgi:hypothetical protein